MKQKEEAESQVGDEASQSLDADVNFNTLLRRLKGKQKKRNQEESSEESSESSEDEGDGEDGEGEGEGGGGARSAKKQKALLAQRQRQQWQNTAITHDEYLDIIQKKNEIASKEKEQKEQRAANREKKRQDKDVENLNLVDELKKIVAEDEGKWKLRQGGGEKGGKILKRHLEAVYSVLKVKVPTSKFTSWLPEVQNLLHWDSASRTFQAT